MNILVLAPLYRSPGIRQLPMQAHTSASCWELMNHKWHCLKDMIFWNGEQILESSKENIFLDIHGSCLPRTIQSTVSSVVRLALKFV